MSIGPELPPELLKQRLAEASNHTPEGPPAIHGPSLPSASSSASADGSSTVDKSNSSTAPKRVMGPAMPSDADLKVAESTARKKMVGPRMASDPNCRVPQVLPAAKGSDSKASSTSVREEWMLVPPSKKTKVSRDDQLKARTFSTSGFGQVVDSSSWTATPEERSTLSSSPQKRKRATGSGVQRDPEDLKYEEWVKSHKSTHSARSKPLVERYQMGEFKEDRKKYDEAKAAESTLQSPYGSGTSGEGSTVEVRPSERVFDRDKDFANYRRRTDMRTRDSIMDQATKLDSKFRHAGTRHYL